MATNNMSINKLSEDTGISRQTLCKIRDNKFYDISSNILTQLLTLLEINYYDFGSVYSHFDYLQEKLSELSFNEENIKKLKQIINLKCGTKVKLKFSSYNSNQSLNFRSSIKFKKMFLNGNIRINTECIDFDFDWNPSSEKDDLNEFYALYFNILDSFETYAKEIGFSNILISILNYLDIKNEVFLFPVDLERDELSIFINRNDYSIKDNETIKKSISIKKGYQFLESDKCIMDIQKNRDKVINNYSSLYKPSPIQKEQARIKNTKEATYQESFRYTYYVKMINEEFIYKERLRIENQYKLKFRE
ncbi:helix-turn-helix domain-containing protein [Vagococcus silagei]|uniref:XRE family transcriptional regulator n=1 Tax=Vagococcus silagei TaxID=2508885 RepID=A0A4S3B6U3_9ENTE|nr:XRE family transcriptional regulator [Vagococcus silagei]